MDIPLWVYGFGFKERISISPGEIVVSNDDGFISSPSDQILSPNGSLGFEFKHKLFNTKKIQSPWNLAIRSGMAQAGLNAELNKEKNQVTIMNLHPSNRYLFPKGDTAFARIYSKSEPISGDDLENVLDTLITGTNTFNVEDSKPKIEGNLISIPLLDDYAHNVGTFIPSLPINIRELPSGIKRREIMTATGTGGVHEPVQVGGARNKTGFRLLMTPYFEVPSGILLFIENKDHLKSPLIDSGFKGLVVCEFSDNLCKSEEDRTISHLFLSAYRQRNI